MDSGGKAPCTQKEAGDDRTKVVYKKQRLDITPQHQHVLSANPAIPHGWECWGSRTAYDC